MKHLIKGYHMKHLIKRNNIFSQMIQTIKSYEADFGVNKN